MIWLVQRPINVYYYGTPLSAKLLLLQLKPQKFLVKLGESCETIQTWSRYSGPIDGGPRIRDAAGRSSACCACNHCPPLSVRNVTRGCYTTVSVAGGPVTMGNMMLWVCAV